MTLAEAIRAISAAGPVEVRENGQRLAALDSFEYEVREQASRIVLHLWSDQRTLARRVLRIVELEPSQISLEVERFGRARPDRLEIVAAGPLSAARLTREKFRERFADLLHEQFPDDEIESLSTAADLEHSLSGSYTRGVLHARGGRWALLAASPSESNGTMDAMLTFGLLWLRHTREHAGGSVHHRLAAVSASWSSKAHRAPHAGVAREHADRTLRNGSGLGPRATSGARGFRQLVHFAYAPARSGSDLIAGARRPGADHSAGAHERLRRMWYRAHPMSRCVFVARNLPNGAMARFSSA